MIVQFTRFCPGPLNQWPEEDRIRIIKNREMHAWFAGTAVWAIYLPNSLNL